MLTTKKLAIEALEWLQNNPPISKISGICSNLVLYSRKYHPLSKKEENKLYKIVYDFSIGWRGIHKATAWPIDKVIANNLYLKAEVARDKPGYWVGENGRLRQEFIKHLLTQLKKEQIMVR